MKILEFKTKQENSCKSKLQEIVKRIIIEQPDVFSLQGVSQSLTSPRLVMTDNLGYVPDRSEHIRIRLDNSALCIAEMLKRERLLYRWTWVASVDERKEFEHGMAVFVKEKNDLEQHFFEEVIKRIKETNYE